MNLKHFRALLFFALMNLPMDRHRRPFFAKFGGVKFVGKGQLVGKNVSFDTLFPENIKIGSGVHIADEVVFLTHWLDTRMDGLTFKSGFIEVGENTFIGRRTIITKPLTIGKNAIIGAGAILTKNVPDNEIWAGNPAKKIGTRVIDVK